MEVHDIVQDGGIKTIPKEKKCKKAKLLSEEALQIAHASQCKNIKQHNKKKKKKTGRRSKYTFLQTEHTDG